MDIKYPQMAEQVEIGSSDGASGGGAGGTIIMNVTNSYSGALTIEAKAVMAVIQIIIISLIAVMEQVEVEVEALFISMGLSPAVTTSPTAGISRT